SGGARAGGGSAVRRGGEGLARRHARHRIRGRPGRRRDRAGRAGLMAESRTLGKRLHRGYYLLAVFEVVTVAGALYLAHQMTRMFDESLEANRAWQQRVGAYAALDESLADVRPPLDELFVSENLPEERRRFAAALATFDRLAATARQE